MSNSRSIIGIIVLFFALLIAVWLGSGIATEQSTTIIQFGIGALIICCLLLGRKIWLLMIFFGAMNVPIIRGFSSLEIGQCIFLGFSLLLFLMRKLRVQIRMGELECWMLLIALSVVQSYLRNPVGLNMFGSDAVGARPYFVVCLSLVSSLLLAMHIVPANELKWAMRLSFIGGLAGIPLGELRGGYSQLEAVGGTEVSRVPWLGQFSSVTCRWLTSKISPLKSVLKPLYLLGFLIAIVAAAGSGYRNSVAMVGLMLLVGVYYHHGIMALLMSLVAGAVLITLMAAVNIVMPLPGTVQRALSPFPGTWEERYIEAGDNSTEWRVEMWKAALTSDYWIHNKTLGDGLGMTRVEMERLLSISSVGRLNWKGTSGLTLQQESMMVSGGYHSGPVHTIRTVGYVGLAILLLAMIRVAVYAHRQIMRCRGTPWFQVSLYLCIPSMVLPFFWVFIFGEFQSGVAGVAFGAAMVRLLERNLPLPVRRGTRFTNSSVRERSIPPQQAEQPA